MVNRTRKIITVPATSIDIEYSTLGDAAKTIAELIEHYGPDAKLKYYEPAYTDSKYLYVFETRLETDDEMNTRILQEECWEVEAVERDRKEFERLSKLYGKT